MTKYASTVFLRNPSRPGQGPRKPAKCLRFCSAVFAALLLITGCQAPAVPTAPTETVLRIPDRDAFLDTSLSVLRRYDLQPKYVDRAAGRIVTERTTSGQWFELWRADSRGAYQALESSLHTMGRIATVSVEPLDSPEQCRVSVRVDKERYSATERQITTASGALGIYSERVPTTEGLRRAATARAHWVPLGRDALLETFLLARLEDAAASDQVAHPSEPRP